MNERKFTPGPWEWRVQPEGKSVMLVSHARMMPIVMDFWRWGFRSAAPTFRDAEHDLLKRVDDWMTPSDGCIGHHRGVAHPDAHLISAAPDMYDALEQAISLIEGWNAGATEDDVKRVMGVINCALMKANGG